ncbi:MAG: hypothetical protein V4487_08030 [Chlamydiota bacterium]
MSRIHSSISSGSWSTNSESSNDSIVEIFNQIYADPSISEEEKNLIRQIDGNNSIENFEQIERVLNQLIAGAGDAHPYAYFYHFLKGICMLSTEERGTDGWSKDYNLAIESLDESIRLNPQFKDSYYIRGVTVLLKNGFFNMDPGAIQDLRTAASLGSKEAEMLLEMFEISYS